MPGFGIEGKVLDFHLESQTVWYKPWTWLKKPVRVIDNFDLTGLSFVQDPVDLCCLGEDHVGVDVFCTEKSRRRDS